MLALAFVPSLSHALQLAPFAGLGVCSTPGSLPSGSPDGMPPGHCPLCAHALDGPLGLPASEAGWSVASSVLASHGSGFTQLPPQRRAWASSPARAPPTSSV